MANKALLVGINKYLNAPLRGCVNDAQDVADFAVSQCGFKMPEIRLLTDERATTRAIRDRLQWLIAGATPGDRLLFHYSGHGSQLTDRAATNGEVIALHDCICPVDFDFTPEHAITDDQFMAIFKPLPEGIIFNWLSDSCHSGDLARLMNTPRQFPMPVDLLWRIKTAKSLNLQPAGFAKAVKHLHGAFISGCRSDQTSADAFIFGRSCGAFTNAMLVVLKNGGLKNPLVDVVKQVNEYLHKNHYDQEPQLRGDDKSIHEEWLNLHV